MIDFEEIVQAMGLQFSLPESWSGIVISASSSMFKETIKIDDVKKLLFYEDLRRKNIASSNEIPSTLMMNSKKARLVANVGKYIRVIKPTADS